MKVAITRATGFIGKLLVEKHLGLGDEVNILSRRKKSDVAFHDKVNCFFGDFSEVNFITNPKFRFPISLIKLLAKIFSFIPKNPLTVARVNALSNRTIYSISKIENELG